MDVVKTRSNGFFPILSLSWEKSFVTQEACIFRSIVEGIFQVNLACNENHDADQKNLLRKKRNSENSNSFNIVNY